MKNYGSKSLSYKKWVELNKTFKYKPKILTKKKNKNDSKL